MQTRRDKTLIIALCIQAAMSAAATSALLSELFPRPVVAAVGLVSAMLSSATAVYVSLTREPGASPERVSNTLGHDQ